MQQCFPLRIRRTDGLLQYQSKGQTLLNQPTKTDPTPSEDGDVNYYEKLNNDHALVVEWRYKLGNMLMNLLDIEEHRGKKVILDELPEDYILWQQVKSNPKKDGDTTVKGNRGLRRRDVFLYGYPEGRSKRYKSPQEFFPHMLWLSTDVDGDRDNCSCKWCSPDEKDPPGVPENVQEPAPVKPTPTFLVKTTPDEISKPTLPNTTRVMLSLEQRLDGDPDSPYLYRPGELVWYQKKVAWGLSVICKRQNLNSVSQYLLQPLSHPLEHKPPCIRTQDSIRPWLGWSIPITTCFQLSNLTYDQVQWDRAIRGEFGHCDAVVDASILASKQIDASYTLFDRLDIPTAGLGEVHYTGMFLGAEKIWVGEPIRLRVVSNDVAVMVIHQMIEKTVGSNSSLTIVGDIYEFVSMPTPYKDRKDWPTPDLPARMVQDYLFRNEVADNAKNGVWQEWRLLEPNARRGLLDMKGRWYETQTMLPILRGVDWFRQEVTEGIMTDCSIWMNGRGDSNVGPGQRKKNRLDTLGSSVPPGLKISRGLNGHPTDDVFPEGLVDDDM